MDNGKVKVGSIRPPMSSGKLMCEVERTESAREREA